MATLTARLMLAGKIAEIRTAAHDALSQGAAIGLTAALAGTVEAIALFAALGRPDRRGRLAGGLCPQGASIDYYPGRGAPSSV